MPNLKFLLPREAIKSVLFRREGFYGSSGAQNERPLCLTPCFAWGCGCSASVRTEIPVFQPSWLSHPALSERADPFFRNGSATWLWYSAWISDQTNQEGKMIQHTWQACAVSAGTSYIYTFTATAVRSPGITGQWKDPRGRRTEVWLCPLALVWPHASHSASRRLFLYLKTKGRWDYNRYQSHCIWGYCEYQILS